MDNFIRFPTRRIFSLAAVVLSATLLQACGGQRDEPFNSDGSVNASSSSRGAKVAIKELFKGTEPITAVPEEGIQVHILDEDTFDSYWERYTDDSHEVLDFDKGQVLLVDLGKKKSCEHKISFKTYEAYQDTLNSVQVFLNYKDVDTTSASSRSSSSTATSSSCSSTLETQPYYFFYIETRDQIMVVDDAQ